MMFALGRCKPKRNEYAWLRLPQCHKAEAEAEAAKHCLISRCLAYIFSSGFLVGGFERLNVDCLRRSAVAEDSNRTPETPQHAKRGRVEVPCLCPESASACANSASTSCPTLPKSFLP